MSGRVTIPTSTSTPVRVLHDAAAIAARVRDLGLEIARDHLDERPVLVGVLKGAAVFVADLARSIPLEIDLEFVSVSSYGMAKSSSGRLEMHADVRADLTGRRVIVCEAVVDSGRTLSSLLERLRSRGPASLQVATLLDKRPCREIDVPLHYVGWTTGSEFLVGYGLDAGERYRNLPYVGVLEEA